MSSYWNDLWDYNCRDVLATRYAWPELEQQLLQQKNFETYQRQANLIEPLAFMQERGIRMDLNGITQANEAITSEIERLKGEFFLTCGEEINLNSPLQLKKYFYETKGLKAYKNRKTGAESVDSTALKRLSAKGHKEASLLLEIRKLTKLKSTYLEIKLDPDQRLRCSFNPVGTESGRLSSRKTIFGTGANLQNQPSDMKKFMLFDEDYIGYNMDLSQAENRIVAYVGPVPEMMRAFEESLDVHKLTASLIFGKPPENISSEERQWGKRANHGLNYDLGYKSFALIYEIEERDAKYIVERYHQAYPGVRQGFHVQVRGMLQANRTITNCLGRKRLMLDRWGDSLFKEAYAQIPQSTVADIMNERGLGFVYYNSDPIFQPVELLLQVHDSMVFQIPRTIPLSQHAEIIWKLKKSLETPVSWQTRTWIIPADIQASIGHMGKGEGGLKDFSKLQASSPEKIEETLRTYFGEYSPSPMFKN